MHFLPPVGIKDECILSKMEFPETNEFCPFSKGIKTCGPFGSIATQLYKCLDFEIWKHNFEINTPVELLAVTGESPIFTTNYMLKGSPEALLEHVGNIPLTEKTYQFFFLPNLIQNVYFPEGYYESIHVVYENEFLKRMCYRYPVLHELISRVNQEERHIQPIAFGPIEDRTNEIFKEIIKCSREQIEKENRINKSMQELIAILSTDNKTNISSSGSSKIDEEQWQDLINYINDHISEVINIATLVTFMGLNKTDFYLKFKSKFNVSPYRYIQNQRLKQSMHLVVTTSYSIGEIADKCGFENIHYFSTVFKKVYKHPPSFFRNGN